MHRTIQAVSVRDPAPKASASPLPGRWEPGFHTSQLLVHAGAVAAVSMTYIVTEDVPLQMQLAGFITFLTHCHLGVRSAKRSALWFNPLSVLFLWTSIGLGLSPVYIASVLRRDGAISFSMYFIEPEDVLMGYLVFLIGVFFLHCGIIATRPDQDGRAAEPLERKESGIALVFCLIGLAAGWKYEWFTWLGALGGTLKWAPLAAVTMFGLSIKSTRDALTEWGLFGCGIAALFFVSLRTGSKFYVMLSFLPILWWFFAKRVFGLKFVLFVMAALGFYFLILAPTISLSREFGFDQESSYEKHLVGALQEGIEAGSVLGGVAAATAQTEEFLERQYEASAVGFLVGDVRENGLKYGETLRYLKSAFIPRILWPDKPNVSRGAWFTMYLGFSESEAESTTSTGMSTVGEFYWNFGIIGVAAGMFIIGITKGLLWRLAGMDPRTSFVKLWLYTLLTFSMVDMPEAGTLLVSFVFTYLSFRVLTRFF